MFIPLDLMLETLPGYAPVRKGRANPAQARRWLRRKMPGLKFE